jgi:hypothetical protein
MGQHKLPSPPRRLGTTLLGYGATELNAGLYELAHRGLASGREQHRCSRARTGRRIFLSFFGHKAAPAAVGPNELARAALSTGGEQRGRSRGRTRCRWPPFLRTHGNAAEGPPLRADAWRSFPSHRAIESASSQLPLCAGLLCQARGARSGPRQPSTWPSSPFLRHRAKETHPARGRGRAMAQTAAVLFPRAPSAIYNLAWPAGASP